MYEKLSKNALKCMYIASAIAATVLLLIAGMLEVFLFLPKKWEIAHIITGVFSVIILFNAAISPRFRYYRYRYKIDDECIDIIEGYIFTERNIVPIERLHKLQLDRGPIDKYCGVAKVHVTTAGGDVTIRFLDVKKAEEITDKLRKRINDIVIEQKELNHQPEKTSGIQEEKNGK